ncbi:hypothetical protein [Marivirga sp.]|uniref:hypothetical protein n=1 Tax=Marivirga sp. TaxID=2018662 RepID=UPI0025E56FF7|nr:hypothetical protein [Marivirga sp.]
MYLTHLRFPASPSLDESRITSSEWGILKIEAEVPEESNTINYGIYLRDFGSVWLDGIEIEIIE